MARHPDFDGFGTHVPALVWALETFRPIRVLEQGAGWYSTPLLHAWCEARHARLHTVEPVAKWRTRFEKLYAAPWHTYGSAPALPAGPWDLALLDGDRPGERTAWLQDLLASGRPVVAIVHDVRPNPGPRQLEAYGDLLGALAAWPHRKDFTDQRPHTTVVWANSEDRP